MTIASLLDTNIVSDLVRNPKGRVAARIAKEGGARVATSIVVAAELRFGVAKRGSTTLKRQLETILDVLPVLALEPPADRQYGEIRAALERVGTPIGGNDTLIAAHAMSLGLVLVTANLSEFKRVRGLKSVNWLA